MHIEWSSEYVARLTGEGYDLFAVIQPDSEGDTYKTVYAGTNGGKVIGYTVGTQHSLSEARNTVGDIQPELFD